MFPSPASEFRAGLLALAPLLAAGMPFKLGLLVAALAGMAVGWGLAGRVR